MDKFKVFLKSIGYTDEQITAIVEGMKEQKIYLSEHENIDTRYSELKEQKEAADNQLKTANTTIENLKKDNPNAEDLQGKIKDYESMIETMKKDAYKKEFDLALENELTKLNVHSSKAARAELDLEKVKYENGVFEGLKEQTDTWSKEKAFLINTGKTTVIYTPPGGDPTANKSYAATLAESKNQASQNPYAKAWGMNEGGTN